MMNTEQTTVELAIGKIFRMMSRPTEPGDVAEYERCRAIILDIAGGADESNASRAYHGSRADTPNAQYRKGCA